MDEETIDYDSGNPEEVVKKLPGEVWHEKNNVTIVNNNDKRYDSLNDILGSRALGLMPTK